MGSCVISPITAVRFVRLHSRPCIFAGCGPELRVYYSSEDDPFLQKVVLPHGTRIHGILVRDDGHIAIHGGRYLAYCSISLSPHPDIKIIVCSEFDDWIFHTAWLRARDRLIVVLGYGRAVVCTTSELKSCVALQCSEKEICWSAASYESQNDRGIDIVHGTSFGDILFWSCASLSLSLATFPSGILATERIAQRLKGHYGPVMKLKFSESGDYLASASVDRSARVWKRERFESEDSDCAKYTFLPVRVHFGHLARVWDVQFNQDDGPGVLSVGEDRACRVWSSAHDSRELYCFQGHDGRNVWCVDVLYSESNLMVVTGGEDGVLKIRVLPRGIARDFDEKRTEAGGVGELDGYALPDSLKNPRKLDGGGTNESARTVLACSSRHIVVTTDFGRVLSCKIAGNGEGYPRGISWTTLYRDEDGTAFVPNALVISSGLLCAGQTDGKVVVVEIPVEHDETSEHRAWTFPATGEDSNMVMGIFARAGSNPGVSHVFVVAPQGKVLHWVLSRKVNASQSSDGMSIEADTADDTSSLRNYITCALGSIGENENTGHIRIGAFLVAVYEHSVVKKNMLATCVAYLPCCEIILVGDRGGRVHVYTARRNVREGARESQNGPVGLARSPLCSSRPHSDRVTALERIPCLINGNCDCTGEHEILTSSFDGRMSRLVLQTPEVSLEVLSSQRSIERVETICRIFFPCNSDQHCRPVHNRQCVVGFRSTDIVMWDVQQRNEVFRWNCGNWRRAFDMHVEMTSFEGNGPLVIQRLVFVFWRAGRLFVVERGKLNYFSSDESKSTTQNGKTAIEPRMQSIGPAFHGQRVNAICLVPVADIQGKSRFIMTAGEDTVLRVMRIDNVTGQWQTVQVLTQHKSGVYGVSATRSSERQLIAVSGGGCDEVIIWAAMQECGPWVNVSIIHGSATISPGVAIGHGKRARGIGSGGGEIPIHRVLSVVCLPFLHCVCSRNCVMAILGRSDASVSLLRCNASDEKMECPVLASSWNSRVVDREKKNKGAVMSLAVTCVGTKFIVASGDSCGFVCIWEVDRNVACYSRKLRLLHRWHALEGGILSMSATCEGNSVIVGAGGDCGNVGAFVVSNGNVKSAKRLVSAGALTGVSVIPSELGILIIATGASQCLFSCRLHTSDDGEVEVGKMQSITLTEVVDASDLVVYRDAYGSYRAVVSGRGLQAAFCSIPV